MIRRAPREIPTGRFALVDKSLQDDNGNPATCPHTTKPRGYLATLRTSWDTSNGGRFALLENGDWAGIEGIGEDEIVREGGGSAHETKNWIAAFAAASGRALTTRQRWYRAIPELIAGFGVMLRVG